MESLEMLMSVVDYMMASERKRHMIGGTLMGISLLFGGLAFTVMTAKKGENNNE